MFVNPAKYILVTLQYVHTVRMDTAVLTVGMIPRYLEAGMEATVIPDYCKTVLVGLF